MQQEYVLTELQEYGCAQPAPSDHTSVMEVVKYLQACNALFKRGLLGKRAFTPSKTSPVLTSISKGYSFFKEWADEMVQQGQLFLNDAQLCYMQCNCTL